MKRRLRPSIQRALEVALFLLIGFIACITDFDLKAIPIIIISILSILMIGSILKNYGKYEEE